MSDVDSRLSMFERIGGAVIVDRLVETFYDRVDTLPEAATIRAMHGPDLGPTRQIFKRYLCEWMGGPTAPAPHGISNRRGRARRVAALHVRCTRTDSQRRRSPAGNLCSANEARQLDAQPGRQPARCGQLYPVMADVPMHRSTTVSRKNRHRRLPKPCAARGIAPSHRFTLIGIAMGDLAVRVFRK
jgi:truncated hemoglobin YjbI